MDKEQVSTAPTKSGSAAAALTDQEVKAGADETARYALELLLSLKGVTNKGEHAFLSYLIGLAAEEAIRLAEGQPSLGPRQAAPVAEGKKKRRQRA